MKEQNKERDRELIQKTQLLIDLQHEIASLHNEVLKLNDLVSRLVSMVHKNMYSLVKRCVKAKFFPKKSPKSASRELGKSI